MADNDQQRNDTSWLSDVSENDWTTVDMIEIPANVNLLDTHKKRRGSVVRSFRRESESEDESEVEVIDSEGEEEERGIYHLVANDVEDATTREDKRDSMSFDVSV